MPLRHWGPCPEAGQPDIDDKLGSKWEGRMKWSAWLDRVIPASNTRRRRAQAQLERWQFMQVLRVMRPCVFTMNLPVSAAPSVASIFCIRPIMTPPFKLKFQLSELQLRCALSKRPHAPGSSGRTLTLRVRAITSLPSGVERLRPHPPGCRVRQSKGQLHPLRVRLTQHRAEGADSVVRLA